MEGSRIDEALATASRRFERPPTDVERGLDVEEDALLQLRKACRLRAGTDRLAERDGHHTLVVEASFACIERSLQFYLLDAGVTASDDYLDHERVYELGRTAGLYDAPFAERLRRLWRNNRSRTYYREGVATAGRARAMAELAGAMHAHVTDLAGRRHDCLCG